MADYDNQTWLDYDNTTSYTYKLRYLKGITINAQISLDIKLTLDLTTNPVFNGSFEIDIPISITIRNKTLVKIPLPDKPVRVPIYYPIINLPSIFGDNTREPLPSNAHASYFDNDAMYDYLDRPGHYLTKRSLAAHSAEHRHEVFTSIESTLDR